MSKIIALMAILVLLTGSGCTPEESAPLASREEQSAAVTVTANEPLNIDDPSLSTISNTDGLVQEEVVYVDTDEFPNDTVEAVEVPKIIIAALTNAPDGIDSTDCSQSRIDMILVNQDGSVQEEVVYLESDEEIMTQRQSAKTQVEEVVIASLQRQIVY